jgi:two-component system sensor kinase FixL
MAASLAHELNQPLTGITNSASAERRFIARGKADIPKLDELLEALVGDAQRAGNIIRNIRGMTRKGEGVRTSVDLNGLVSDVALFIHSDALERHCVVVTEPDPNLPLVKGNPVLLQQVLLNIIVNAFDAMEKTPLEKRRELRLFFASA